MLPKPYKYKKPKKWKQSTNLNRIKPSPTDEGLTGAVKNEPASEYEERFARALHKKKLPYYFQTVLPTGFQIPGQLNTIDFLVTVGSEQPIEIDGDWVHKNGSQKDRDLVRDAIINAQMMPQGWMPILRVPGYKLETQEDADKTVEEMF